MKKLYASKEVKENALVSEGRSCRPETIIAIVIRYVCHDLLVWNMRLKSHLLRWKRRTLQSIIYQGEEKKTLLE